MTKRVSYYIRLRELRVMLAQLAEESVGAEDIDGATTKLHATEVVVALDKRINSALLVFTSAEQSDYYRSPAAQA